MRHGEQNQIAEWTGLSAGMLCQIFKGDKRPSPESAKRLEKRTGVDLRDWLFMPADKLKHKVYLAWMISGQNQEDK
jgi:transcriptional regulator with XRE-family HTH domain